MEKLPPSPEMVQETLRDLDEQVEKLEKELNELRHRRQTWAAILTSLLSLEEMPVMSGAESHTKNERLVASTSFSREMNRASTISTAEYGEFTGKMRHFLLVNKESLTPRSEIVKYAREMKTSTNFPYHFINRMLENGELREPVKGRYQPTELMLAKATVDSPWIEVMG